MTNRVSGLGCQATQARFSISHSLDIVEVVLLRARVALGLAGGAADDRVGNVAHVVLDDGDAEDGRRDTDGADDEYVFDVELKDLLPQIKAFVGRDAFALVEQLEHLHGVAVRLHAGLSTRLPPDPIHRPPTAAI